MNLYPYQERGVTFLASKKRAYLADEMGLGKTVQAIVAARRVEAERTLVVAPAAAKENWKREWRTWNGPGRLTVTSYAAMIRRPHLFVGSDWSLVILDEAHYVKTPSAQRTRIALKLAEGAPRAWLLSGTPMPNNLVELYPVLRYLWPHTLVKFGLRTKEDFMDYFTEWSSTSYGPRVYGLKHERVKLLMPWLKTFILRRMTAEVGLELPSLRVDVSLLPANSGLDAELRSMALDETGQDMNGEVYMATLRRVLGKWKAAPVAQIVRDELKQEQYKKIVVLYHHRGTRETFERVLGASDINVVGFDGSATSSRRQNQIDLYNDDGFEGVFLAQQTAAGVAINLQSGHEIILTEPSWTPSDNRQAIKRVHRIGQTEPVRARIFAVADTLDDKIMETIARKTRMIEYVETRIKEE